MAYDRLDPATTAVLFFDVLNVGYQRPDLGPEERREKEAVVANCVRLRDAADRLGAIVCYACANHRDDGRNIRWLYTDTDKGLRPREDPERQRLGAPAGRRAGRPEGEVVEELRPRPDDYVIPKNRWSAFFQTNLELNLRTAGVDTIVLAGGSTKSGIASTAYAARDHDYHLVLVRDATVGACSHDGGTQQDFDWMMDRLFPRLARVRTTEETVQMLEASRGAARR